MEFKKSFTTQKGSTVDFTVNCSVSNTNTDDKKELLSRFAEISREIYLEIAADISKFEKNAYPENSDNTEKENRINVYSAEGCKEIFAHYDLSLEDTKNLRTSGFDSENFSNMCEIIGNVWKINSRVRITLNYDPNYPKSLVKTEFF